MLNKFTRTLTSSMKSEDNRTFDAAISSENPVPQLDPKTGRIFLEILEHNPGSMSVQRGKNEVKLRWNHDGNTLIGVAENIRLDLVTRTARANIKFGNSAQAEGLRKDVLDGIATDLSVGYQYSNNNVTIDKSTNPETRTIHKFQINEVSVVPEGADDEVGFGRALDPNATFVDTQNQAQPEEGETGMPLEEKESALEAKAEKDTNTEEAEEELRSLKVRVKELEDKLRCSNERSEDLAQDEEKGTDKEGKPDNDEDEDDGRSQKIITTEDEITETRSDISSNVEEVSTRSTTTYEENKMENNDLKVTQPAVPSNLRERDYNGYSISKMIRGLMTGGHTGLEREIAQELHSDSIIPTQVIANVMAQTNGQRAFALNGSAGAGAEFKVPLFGGYLDLLLPETLFGKLGCPTMNLAQPVTLPGGDVPVPTNSTEVGFGATGATESDPTSRNVLFSPLIAISQIALTRVMLESSTPGTDAYLVNLMRKRHASNFEDQAYQRILSQITQTYVYSGGDVSADYGAGLLGLVQKMADQIDEPATSAFVTNHSMYNKLSQVKRSANLTVPVAGNGQIWDRPAVASARVKRISNTYDPIIYAAWEHVQLASFGSGVNIVVDQVTKALNDQVLITAQAHWDAELMQPVAAVKCVDAY